MARLSDRRVRPPIQIGTRSWTAWGSMIRSSNLCRPVVADATGRQARAKATQCIVGAHATVVERHAELCELLLQRPHPDTQDEPATADHVERAVPLGDLEGMVVPEHEHERCEADALGDGGEIAERSRVGPNRSSRAGRPPNRP